MTLTPYITLRGKAIHILSLDDLIDAVESGERLRAYCPIHGSDHQRSLSIDRTSGWGFCHCCHATVLVEAMNPMLVVNSAAGRDHRKSTGAAYPLPFSLRSPVAQPARPATTAPDWQREEVAALQALTPLMREALATSQRARMYLEARGVPPAVALASGVGYLSHAMWEQIPVSAEQHCLKRWIGRILFPLSSPFGQGFIGRTLLKWEPGMDENGHKALLDLPGAPKRWIKTNPAGWFGIDTLPQARGPLILVEGGFDRLALLSAGMPAESVIALAGTAARPSWLLWLAPQVKDVVLALDADPSGEEAMARLADELRQAGFIASLCPPPHDRWGKDWSERWRRLGPQSLWPLYEALARQQSALEERGR
jgi:DNA primase